MDGIVKWFSSEKGYGFIRGADGVDYYFHITDFQGDAPPKSRDKVIFDPTTTKKGPRAINVRLAPVDLPVNLEVPRTVLELIGPGESIIYAKYCSINYYDRNSVEEYSLLVLTNKRLILYNKYKPLIFFGPDSENIVSIDLNDVSSAKFEGEGIFTSSTLKLLPKFGKRGVYKITGDQNCLKEVYKVLLQII
ncbi:cold shock domain-containing protein [Thermococcus aciditolerans]|uniref:cold shock domain-containing protein n=1 Tax=Thermococcus aciditolerans TaxID=2598455 RepID=UPI00143CC341|nr:cold shock domain-containing protein [Thermococcus aciditolerans]